MMRAIVEPKESAKEVKPFATSIAIRAVRLKNLYESTHQKRYKPGPANNEGGAWMLGCAYVFKAYTYS